MVEERIAKALEAIAKELRVMNHRARYDERSEDEE